jgi:hypothetical protein
VAALLGALVAACNAGKTSSPPNPPSGSGGGGGAIINGSDSGVTVMPSGKVQIVIDTPMADVIESSNAPIDVMAHVSVVTGSDVIDPASVHVAIVARGGTAMLTMGKLVGPAGADVYRGQVSVAGLNAGNYTLLVTAATTTGIGGQKAVDIVIDSGPTIIVVSPAPGGHYKNGLQVQIIADAGAFAPLQNLQANVGGMPLTLTNDPPGTDQFKAILDFNAPVPPLSGEQLFDVSASNSDGPTGTRAEVKFVFVVDNAGPTITKTTPAPGAVVGGVVDIRATIQDDAGINESTVKVFIGDQISPQFQLPLMGRGDGTFGVLFDTRNLTVCKPPPDPGLCIVLPTISFRAADQLGNETVLTYDFGVDNVPPVADLTPPNLRDSKVDGVLLCSHPFNPLRLYNGLSDTLSVPGFPTGFSGDAPNDLCRVPQAFDLRARVEDDGNRATGLKNPPISTVDPAATAAYILDDSTQPLVVDSDGDGYCDHINPHLVPTTQPVMSSREVLKVRLSPVPVVGAADYSARPDPTPMPDGCTPGADKSIPEIPCLSEQPTIAIGYAGGLPSIWSVDPIDPVFQCFGGQFDTHANNIATAGWKCLAVATADLNGNASVSAPIRVWVDYSYPDPQTFCIPPPANAPPPPSCTGIYNMATDAVSPGACRARNFQPRPGTQEVCFKRDCAICFADDPRCAP